MSATVNRYSNVIQLRERNLAISEIAQRMECSERTVRRLLEQGARSEQRIVDFENSWRKGDVPKIEDFVPSQGNLARQEILEEIVRVDLEYRWRHTEMARESESSTGLAAKPRIEDYVRRFPELMTQGQLPGGLVTEEYRTRMKWGDHPDRSEYEERFPERKNSLAQQLDRVDDDLAAEHNLDDPADVPASPAPPVSLTPTLDSAAPDSAAPDSGTSDWAAQEESSALRPTLDIRPEPVPNDPTASRADKYTTRAEPKKGGMAIVWRAFDSRLNREVAYKELRPDRAAERQFLDMFLDEAQITGQLEHPNIVPVYELGGDASDNRPFYTMKYMRGGTLSDSIDDYHQRRRAGQSNARDVDRLLNIFLDVCHAIRYAHSRGVLHRDLKPDNIMVGNYGEVLVVDWGLAKVLGVSEADLPAVQLSRTDHSFTEVGAKKGTPAYWAPEQAEGRGDLVDMRTDIYGLGGVLFQILTGDAPHPEVDDDSAPMSKNMEVPDPQEIESSVPPALAAICMKSMSTQRSDRYRKVDDLISDIESWRVNEPVKAYRESFSERTLRQVRRNWIASVITVVGLMAVFLVLIALHFMRQHNREGIVASEINAMSQFASSQEAKLMSRVNVLRQDVTFLSTLDHVHAILQSDGGSPADREHLQHVFAKFLVQRPEYMQLRLLNKEGEEVVRVQRNTPEGSVIVIPDQELQPKGTRRYFTETMRVKRGGWYLSSIGLNQENNKKDKNLPVIRGAVPVFVKETPAEDSHPGDDASTAKLSGDATKSSDAADSKASVSELTEALEGIVIINLHFRKLVTDLRDFEEQSASGQVYLTDADGQFLYHPHKDIAFSFERDLDFRLQQVYKPLNQAYSARLKRMVDLDAVSQVALFVKPDLDFAQSDPALWEMLNERMATALISIGTEHENVKYSRGNEGDAILFGVEKEELAQISEQLKAVLPVKLDSRIIGGDSSGDRLAVHYNRLSLEPGNDERSLGLALVVPLTYLEAESKYSQTIFWITLLMLVSGVAALVYFVARKAPHAPRSMTSMT